jgi:hypothetical protein
VWSCACECTRVGGVECLSGVFLEEEVCLLVEGVFGGCGVVCFNTPDAGGRGSQRSSSSISTSHVSC